MWYHTYTTLVDSCPNRPKLSLKKTTSGREDLIVKEKCIEND